VDTEISSCCRLPPSRWKPPSSRGSGPRNVGSSCRYGYRDTVPLSAPLPMPEASLAAGKRTPSRWTLPSQRIPEPRLGAALRSGEGSFPRPAAPNPKLRQGSNGRDRAPQPRAKTAPDTASPERAAADRRGRRRRWGGGVRKCESAVLPNTCRRIGRCRLALSPRCERRSAGGFT
jgi:hypothetical protein